MIHRKQKRTLILCLTAVLLLLILFLLLQRTDSREPPEQPLPMVYSTMAEAVGISVENAAGSWELSLVDDGQEVFWQVNDLGDSIPLYTGLLNATGLASSSLRALEFLGGPGDTLAFYGLTEPTATVRIHFEDQTETVLYLSDTAPDGSSVYVAATGSGLHDEAGSVYLVSRPLVETFLRDVTIFVSPLVTSVVSATPFDRLTLSGSAREEDIVVARSPSEQEGYSDYRMLSPIEHRVEATYGIPPLQSLFSITGEVVALDPDEAALEEYGLLEPASTAVVESEAHGGFTLHAGPQREDGSFYLLREGTPVIYRVTGTDHYWLRMQAIDFFDPYILCPDITTVSEVTVTTPEQAVVFSLSFPHEDTILVEARGETMEFHEFQPYYGTLISTSTVALDPAGPGELPVEPALSIAFRYREERGVQTLRFYPESVRRYFVSLDGETPVFLVSAVYVEQVIRDLELLLAGENVEMYF